MSKFKFIQITDYPLQPASKVLHVTESSHLPDILQAFEDFLRGCGFVFDGSLVIESSEIEDFKPSEEWREKK